MGFQYRAKSYKACLRNTLTQQFYQVKNNFDENLSLTYK